MINKKMAANATGIAMTATPTPDEDREVIGLYTCNSTGIVVEKREYDDVIIIRPATPQLYYMIKRITPEEFEAGYSEYQGDANQAYAYVFGTIEGISIQ